MDKHEKNNHSYHHHFAHKQCNVCQTEDSNEYSFTEMAKYSKQSGNLIMASKLVCNRCRQQIQSVRYYVEANGLAFGRNSKIYKQNILPFINQNQLIKTCQPDQQNSLYERTIEQQIKRSKIYHEGSLPQNCLQLVYYCSFGISQGERHEKIKNIIRRLMLLTPINYANLVDISIIVHYLTCFMSETSSILLVKQIMDRILMEGSPFQQKIDEDYEMPYEPLWRELSQNIHIGNVIMAFSLLLRDWTNFKSKLKILKSINHIFTTPQLKDAFKLPECRVQQPVTQSCQKCYSNNLVFLKALGQQKNMMSIIIKSTIKQQRALNQYIRQVEDKHNKEKQQYINKIIKLKDKIEILEKNHDHSLPDCSQQYQEGHPYLSQITRHKRSRSISEDKLGLRKKYTVKQEKMIVEVQENSEVGSIRILENKVSEDNGATNETEQFRQINQVDNQISSSQQKNLIEDKKQRDWLHRLIVQIPDLDPSWLEPQVYYETLFDKIEKGMIEMNSKIEEFETKCKSLEIQSKRVLAILTRKQERFVPLIHEKDEIIQKYEHALWRMQNMLPVEDKTLGPRIENIINKYKEQFLDTLTIESNLDHTERLVMQEDFMSPNNGLIKSAEKISSVKTPEKPIEPHKQTKTEKKKIKKKSKVNNKNEDKQCVIF